MHIHAISVRDYEVCSDRCIDVLLHDSGIDNIDSIEDIDQIVDYYLKKFKISWCYGILSKRDAALFELKNKRKLVIDPRLQKYPEELLNTHLKKLFLHEIAHCIMNHYPSDLDGWQDDSAMEAAQNISWDQKDHYEYEAEICASVIAFWPEPLFIKRVKEFDYDLLQLAASFKFDVDCCAKYILLRDKDFDGHYLKYNVDYREFEDYYVPDHYDPIFEETICTKDLITHETAIAELIKKNSITVTQKACIRDTDINSLLKVTCKAFYVEKSSVKELCENDRIIVIGHKR